MILPFSTQMNGKPTYFVEKILASLITISRTTNNQLLLSDIMRFMYRYCKFFNLNFAHFLSKVEEVKPKHHTMREDAKERWQEGTKIDFFINCRQKDMFRFAPVLPVVSTQRVLMTYFHSDVIQISIDDRELFGYSERLEFAINDGFDTWEDFFNYFYPKIKAAPKEIYTPKLIHWTDLRC